MKVDWGDSICNHRIYAQVFKFYKDQYAKSVSRDLWTPDTNLTCHTATHMVRSYDGSWAEGYYYIENDTAYLAILDDNLGSEVYFNSGHIGHELLHAAIWKYTGAIGQTINLCHWVYNHSTLPFTRILRCDTRYGLFKRASFNLPVVDLKTVLDNANMILSDIKNGTAPVASNKYV